MYKLYTKELEYTKEIITAEQLFKLSRCSRKLKIYNPKINRIIVIDGSAYNKLIHDGYMHWKEERVLVLSIHEKLALEKWFMFVSNRILNIAYNPEKSLLSLIDRKTSLLQVLLEVYNDYAIRWLLKIDWNSIEMREWRNDIFVKFLNYPNLIPSKHRPNTLYNTFIKSNALGSDHILALAQAL